MNEKHQSEDKLQNKKHSTNYYPTGKRPVGKLKPIINSTWKTSSPYFKESIYGGHIEPVSDEEIDKRNSKANMSLSWRAITLADPSPQFKKKEDN